MILATIASTVHSPELVLQASMPYAHYQWLRATAQDVSADVSDEIAPHLLTVARMLNLNHPAGMWEPWETSIAGNDDPVHGVAALAAAIDRTRDAFIGALEATSDWFATGIWPGHLEQIQAAVDLITRETRIPELFADQAEVLGFAWPSWIAVNLVAQTYSFAGAYSHPLTIDVTQADGLRLEDMLLHECTHVADSPSTAVGPCDVGDGLRDRLAARGITGRDAFNRWHAMYFAACRARVRKVIDSDYEGFPPGSRPFVFMGVPDPYPIWDRFEFGGRNLDQLADDLTFSSS